jgi:geranylgeranyl pyrophosphate synthase
MSEQFLKDIANNIEILLNKTLPKHEISDVYRYAVLPPGKAFRPQLIWSTLKDFSPESFTKEFQNNNSNFHYFSAFIETHHAYTLVHDDLPCMDDDDIRRGKPATHKKYGEWQALLVGDGLLNVSYRLLSKINCQQFHNLFKFCSWCIGAKGLIQGQVLDLSEEMTINFDNLVLTHQLKTARLMQVALVGSYLLLDDDQTQGHNRLSKAKMLFKLGHAIGVVFQLLDDLTELVDEEISKHEQAVNPWLRFKEECSTELTNELQKIVNIIEENKLENLKLTMGLYFGKINNILGASQTIVEKHVQTDLLPVMTLLKRIC